MKPRTFFAAIMMLAFVLTGTESVMAAPAKCAGVTKAKAKACKAAPTALASKKAVVKGKKSRKLVSAKRAIAKKLSAARKRVARARVEPMPVVLQVDEDGQPRLSSWAFYIVNQNTNEVLLQRNARAVLPIASITKLMTAMVVLESGASMGETLTITEDDVDYLKGTGSRLGVGTRLTREEMLRLALMSSENRAASALARNYPGGRAAFVDAMNIKARLVGMTDAHFYDSTGLTPRNVASPRDLSRMVMAAAQYPQIREFSTTVERYVDINGQIKHFRNTNGLVKNPDWNISVSKTGYISEAGRCLVMQAWMHDQPLTIVLMDASGRGMRVVDAQRVRMWLEERPERLAANRKAQQG
ncbi:MAG: serine hydrolase [Azoarcus sp.]|jgi:D-alanyl-D-alanine endopeptidase (penicillin-binding protein 7)|nr:serine hydrolase [Azoarcus sp.]